MATFLDDISIYNAKSAVVIKDLIINGDIETATLLSSLKSTANDESLTTEVRLNALTALINKGQLLDIPTPPYFPSSISFAANQVYTGLHNALDGLNTGDYYHLTYSEYLSVLAIVGGGNAVTFGNLTGEVNDSIQLAAAFNAKENVIASGSASRFFAWDKTWKPLLWSYITSTPSTLAGYGVSSSDTLFDGKYLQPSSVLSSYTIGSNTPVTNSNTLVGAIGNLQAQINSISGSSGTISTVGITTPVGFFLTIGNSPLTGAGGNISLSLASQAQNKVFAAPSGSNGTPLFRYLAASDLPTSGVTADTYGDGTQYPIITVDDYGRITNVSLQTAGGTGTVQSVEVEMPGEFVSGGTNPVTTIGTISFAWDSQAAGLVFASPASSSGTPGFRALEASDIPNIEISQVTNLAAALANNDNLNNLPNNQIWIGNPSSVPTQQSVSGVITINNTGVTSAVDNAFPLTGLEVIPTNTLLGRYDAPDGDVQVVTLSSDFNIDSFGELWLSTPPIPLITAPGQLITYNASLSPTPGQDALPAPTEGQILIGYPTRPAPDEYGLIWVTPGGVIDSIGVDGTVSLLDNSIDYSKLKDSATANVILGVGSTPGAISALNSADATAVLDSFAGTTKGLVPGGSGGDVTKFLNGAGTWTTITGGGTPGGSSGQIQFNDGGTAFGGTPQMEYVVSYGVYATASGFFLTDSASARNYTIGFNLTAVTGNEVWAFPNASSTFVGTNVAQSLTYKTLSTGSKIDLGGAAQYDMWYSADTAGTIDVIAGGAGNIGKYLKYTTGGPVWEGVSVTSTANLDGGAANQIPYQTGPGATGFITAPITADTFLKWNGSAFVWAGAGSGSGTVNAGTQYGIAYYPNATGGTVVDDITPPTAAVTQYFLQSNVLSIGTAVIPTWNTSTGTGSVVLDLSPVVDSATLLQPRIGNGSGNGHIHFRRGNTPGGLANNATLAFLSASKTASFEFNTDGFQSEFLFAAASTTKTYAFPDLTGTVGVIDSTQTLSLGINGTASGKLKLNGSSSNSITLQAPASPTTTTYTLPSADGVSGQVLRTNGSGTLSWVNTGPAGNKYISTTTSVTMPASTAFSLFVSILIPANTFGSGDIFRIVQRTFRPAGTTGAATIRMGFNTANSTSGAGMVWLVGSASSISAGTYPGTTQRHISIDGTTTTFANVGWGSASNDDIFFATNAYGQTTAIDWTINQYLIIGASTSSGADSLTSYFLSVSPLS